MNQLAASQQEAKDALKQEIRRQRESGNLAKAAELQSKLDKLAAQDAQMEKLSKMAKQMAEASQNLDPAAAQAGRQGAERAGRRHVRDAGAPQRDGIARRSDGATGGRQELDDVRELSGRRLFDVRAA